MSEAPIGPHILLTGTYCSANKGDAAMELATAMALRERFPDARITVASPFPDLDRELYAAHAIEVVHSHRRQLLCSAFQLARCATFAKMRSKSRWNWDWLLPEHELRELASSALVVDLSGDMLTEDYGPHVALSHFYPLLLAITLDRPLYLCAQSIGPFKWTRALARWLMNHSERITVRDEISNRYLDDLGVRSDHRRRTADTAFLLPAEPGRDRVRALVGNAEGPIVGVSLSNLVAGKWLPGGTRRSVRIETFVRSVAAMLDRVIAELDANIVFVPHVTGPKPAKDDRVIARLVRSSMCRSERAFAVDQDLTPSAIKGVIAECSLVFGARMHANIAALSSKVPVVAIAYSHKTPGIMELLGQGQFVLPIESLDFDAAFDMIRRCLETRDQQVALLEQLLPGVRKDAAANFDGLQQLLR